MRRAQGQPHKLPHVLGFAILAVVTGCNAYRGVERRRLPDIVTFIAVHRRRLNAAFSLRWKRAPAHTAVRYIFPRAGFGCGGNGFPSPCCPAAGGTRHAGTRQHRAGWQDAARQRRTERPTARHGSCACSPDIAEKSNEIPAAQALLAELGPAPGAIVTLDAMHRQENTSRSPHKPTPP